MAQYFVALRQGGDEGSAADETRVSGCSDRGVA